MRVKHRSGTLTRQFSAILPPYDDAQPSRDVAFSGVAAFISRSDASWPPAGIRKPAVADLMRPVGFRPESHPIKHPVLMPVLNTLECRPNIGQKTNIEIFGHP